MKSINSWANFFKAWKVLVRDADSVVDAMGP